MNLENIREKLDEIDRELIELIAKRQAYMPEVGEYKKKNGLELNQPTREKEIIDIKREAAEKAGLSPELVEQIFKLLFIDAKRIQKK